jgi:hypothetical protein
VGRKLNNVENETRKMYVLEYVEKHWKTCKMRKTHCRSWNMERKLKNLENETQTLFKLNWQLNTQKWGKWEMHTVRPGVWREIRKLWKMRNTHCMTWNVARTSEKPRNEKYTVLDLYYCEKS